MKSRALWYAVSGLLWVGVPLAASAAGLVPCQGAADCNICTFGSLIQNIINFAIGLSIPLAAVMFAYAGWLYFSNRENMAQIEKAHNIFRTVFIGFCIALAAWLIIQTVLKTLAPGYQSWTTFTCNANRPMSGTIGDLFKQSGLPGLSTQGPPLLTSDSVSGCATGSTYNGTLEACVNADGEVTQPVSGSQCPSGSSPDPSGLNCEACYDDGSGGQVCETVPPLPIQEGKGDCSPGALAEDFGEDAGTMSCIARFESSCNTISAGDRVGDGNAASIGIYQINMSNHQVQCDEYNNGQPVNCPAAFSGPVTGRTMRNVTVVNQNLYNQCRTMLMNPSCNSQMAQGILNTEGFGAWSVYKSSCNGV